jgi:predicted phage tail protein
MNRSYRVLVEDRPTELEELHYPAGKGDIKIVPILAGEGGRGLGSILLGGVLIGAALFTGGFSLGVTSFSFSSIAGNLGVALVLGGVNQMLTPTPSTPEEDPDKSFAFNSPVNVSRAGLVIPLIYGQTLVGSSVISAAIETNTVKDDVNPFDIFKQ